VFPCSFVSRSSAPLSRSPRHLVRLARASSKASAAEYYDAVVTTLCQSAGRITAQRRRHRAIACVGQAFQHRRKTPGGVRKAMQAQFRLRDMRNPLHWLERCSASSPPLGAGPARRDAREIGRGAAPRRMLEIQSGAPEIYRPARRPFFLLARVLIHRACRVRLPQPLAIP
jgi:hypothetical protein